MDSLGLIALISGIITIVEFLAKQQPDRLTRVPIWTSGPRLFRLLRLKQRHQARFWQQMLPISIVTSSVLLSFGVAVTYLLYFSSTQTPKPNSFNLNQVYLLFIVFGLPIFLLIDDYQTVQRVRRRDHSRVFIEEDIEIEGDYKTIMAGSYQVLTEMGAHIFSYDLTTGWINAELKNSLVKIEIKNKIDTAYWLHITSDSMILSVRFDFGTNKKNLSEFSARLMGK